MLRFFYFMGNSFSIKLKRYVPPKKAYIKIWCVRITNLEIFNNSKKLILIK